MKVLNFPAPSQRPEGADQIYAIRLDVNALRHFVDKLTEKLDLLERNDKGAA